jgi:hypothetical protein
MSTARMGIPGGVGGGPGFESRVVYSYVGVPDVEERHCNRSSAWAARGASARVMIPPATSKSASSPIPNET